MSTFVQLNCSQTFNTWLLFFVFLLKFHICVLIVMYNWNFTVEIFQILPHFISIALAQKRLKYFTFQSTVLNLRILLLVIICVLLLAIVLVSFSQFKGLNLCWLLGRATFVFALAEVPMEITTRMGVISTNSMHFTLNSDNKKSSITVLKNKNMWPRKSRFFFARARYSLLTV